MLPYRLFFFFFSPVSIFGLLLKKASNGIMSSIAILCYQVCILSKGKFKTYFCVLPDRIIIDEIFEMRTFVKI